MPEIQAPRPVVSVVEAMMQRALHSASHSDRPIVDSGRAGIDATPSSSQILSWTGEAPALTEPRAEQATRRRLFLIASTALLLIANRLLPHFFQVSAAQLPAPLACMILVPTSLALAHRLPGHPEYRVPPLFEPQYWATRWIPILAVAPLLALPLAMQGVAIATMARLGGASAAGWLASILVAAVTVDLARDVSQTELTRREVIDGPLPPLSPFVGWRSVACSTIVASAGLMLSTLGSSFTRLGAICALASAVNGYIVGTALPQTLKQSLRPLVLCALFLSEASLLWQACVGVRISDLLRHLVHWGRGLFGAGDIALAILLLVALYDTYVPRRSLPSALTPFGRAPAPALA